MKTIKINFSDFYPYLDVDNNFIVNTLRLKYDVVLTEYGQADYIFLSVFGQNILRKDNAKAIKILFSGENISPDFNLADYGIASDYIQFEDRYLRLPFYCTRDCYNELSKLKVFDDEKMLNRKFCSFVFSNQFYAHPIRKDIFDTLSRYKKVDSGGALFNNVGGRVADKLEFIKDYKFNIAFENSMVRGYTTEKIMEPMTVCSLPVYWGNPLVHLDFNPKSFVNASDFSSLTELAKYIEHLDKNDADYLDILHQPWFAENNYLDWQEKLLEFLSSIIDKDLSDAKRLQEYGTFGYYSNRYVKDSVDTKLGKLLKQVYRKYGKKWLEK